MALGASALGLAIAYKLPLLLLNRIAEPGALRLTPDGVVLAYATALAVFACFSFGLAPALHATRAVASRRLPLRNLLLAAQVTLSVVLLMGAGLMLRSLADLRNRDPGFAIEDVSTIAFELPARSYDPRIRRRSTGSSSERRLGTLRPYGAGAAGEQLCANGFPTCQNTGDFEKPH